MWCGRSMCGIFACAGGGGGRFGGIEYRKCELEQYQCTSVPVGY
jgi:hypothetical protein